jgi:tetratricopeptide (TPR) repeat protein/predicted Ser/Thr protein kinase
MASVDDTATVVERSPGPSAGEVAAQIGLDPRAIGRFQILRRLGQGGMGVVFSAYDEELDRRVAIKLLRGDRLRDPEARQQFRSEAQAMARLSHPNVVQIYEVGEHEEQLYIAMEFVQGRTLRRWWQEHTSWRERLAVIAQAGRGLEAAHAAGLVHRDFKPDNVMIDAGGRARVLDFGLAQTREDRIAAAIGSVALQLPGSRQTGANTRGIAGTPAYMAPEQQANGTVDPRGDQFSFCVVLYEAVYGERPFQAATAEALAEAIAQGRVKPPRRDRGAPRWLERAILRGLAVDPAARWPTIGALLAIVERDPARRRRGWLATAVAAGSLAIAAATIVGARDSAAGRCSDAEQRLVGVWDEANAEAVRKAMLATGLPYAERAWQTTKAALDRYARDWSTMHVDACEATHVRGEQSAELLDLRMGCLRRALAELDALVAVLATSDPTTVEHAARAPGLLPRLDACADAEALYHPRRPEPGVVAAAEALRDELATVKALIRVGRFAAARDALTPLLARAEALGEPTALADVLFFHGDLAGKLGDYEAASRGIERSFTRALAGQDDQAAARAAIESIFVSGYFRALLPEGERWQAIAEALLERMGEDGLLRARHASYVAVLHEERGDKVGAAELHRRSIAGNRRVGAPPFTIAAGLNNLAVALGNSGQLDEAIAAYEEALAIYREVVGEQHPNYATTVDNMATAYSARGDLDAALTMHLDALRRREALIGPTHPSLGVTLANIAGVYLDRGETERALPFAERAVAITRAALGDEHPLALSCAVGLAHVITRGGDLARARAEIERIMAVLAGTASHRPQDLAYPTLVRAEIDLAAGEPAAAAEGFARVLELRTIMDGATHRELGLATFGLVRARWATGAREGLAELVAQADAHFVAIHDEAQRRAIAEWAREHP